ncbi:MAG: hypothetical protein SFV24_19065 [Gemmatimonadales bacterium]|nr:hypothetical protein [Gemmatimonadales bacterium]
MALQNFVDQVGPRISADWLNSVDQIKEAWFAATTAEIAAGVIISSPWYQPGDPRRYGADPTGVSDSTTAIQSAINVALTVTFYGGTYKANNLIQTTDFQRFRAIGDVKIVKNDNGPLITTSGDDVEFEGIGFRGDALVPTFSGDGIVSSGNNLRLRNCGCRWIAGVPVRATGNHVQILGTCDIYQTSDATATGYDIIIGQSGTATLYHHIASIYSSQPTGGIKFIDTGSANIIGSQFGKLTIAAGTLPGGVNGGNIVGNRINGDISVGIPSATFSANAVAAVTVTFEAGSSGHTFDDSNVVQLGATIVDNSSNSLICDLRVSPPQSYAIAWTGATTNPTIGNGVLTGVYAKRGREVMVTGRLVIGSTTTLGTGAWYFSLPFTPNASFSCEGAARVLDSGTNLRTGVVETLLDSTARCQVIIDSDTAAIDPTRPMAWATGDELRFTLRYWT